MGKVQGPLWLLFCWKICQSQWQREGGKSNGFMGDRGRKIMKTFTFENETVQDEQGQQLQRSKKENIDEVMDKSEEYFSQKRNEAEVMKASLLEKRVQGSNELFEDFYTDLLLLVKSCGFCADDQDKLVRNAIALRAKDKEVRERGLDKGSQLTLDQACDIATRFKASRKAFDNTRKIQL